MLFLAFILPASRPRRHQLPEALAFRRQISLLLSLLLLLCNWTHISNVIYAAVCLAWWHRTRRTLVMARPHQCKLCTVWTLNLAEAIQYSDHEKRENNDIDYNKKTVLISCAVILYTHGLLHICTVEACRKKPKHSKAQSTMPTSSDVRDKP